MKSMNEKVFDGRKIGIITLIVSVLLIITLFIYSISMNKVSGSAYKGEPFSAVTKPIPSPTPTPVANKTNKTSTKKEQKVSTDTQSSELELLALVTVAEAEGECEEGQRLVIDTILNRVDHPRFPNSIKDVIYAPNQFTSMWNGRVDRSRVTDDIRRLVSEEMQHRTNSEVIFFRTGKYASYGTPLFKVGNHYFSKY